MNIPIVCDAELLTYGVIHYHCWNLQTSPHVLIHGASGSGKSYASSLILARIGLMLPDTNLTVLDWKNDGDWSFLSGLDNYYAYSSCFDGLQTFHTQFLKTQSEANRVKARNILYIDEYAAMVNGLEKREADETKRILASLLMLSRSYNYHIMVGVQRPDAELFSRGSRDNYSLILGMGNLSKESANMLGFDRESMNKVPGRGYGHMLLNGASQTCIFVPKVQNVKKLQHFIRLAVSRN